MADSAPSSSAFFRFFDAFLQERNIKWVLTAGLAILLGSSVMMVTSHWDTLGDLWKYSILLSYVGAIHLAGQWTYHHLSLQKTGSSLMALTVLLIPLSFVAAHVFVLDAPAGGLSVSSFAALPISIGLLGANSLFAVLASRRIFRHFLGEPQPTFTACYLLLCLAGAIAPSFALQDGTSIWAASLALWSVFCLGAVKVNRHVFWLVETHNAPRIVGFVPIMLLGAQFLGLFAMNFAPHLDLPWMGLGLVLFSIPVLLTADAVADVFQKRTGDLVRQLPWSIALPITLGTALCLGGVACAIGDPRALVPTAFLSAIVMGLVARRTRKHAFVWLMLGGVVVAYNFSPVFFVELAKQVVDAGAAAVHETKLPYAFYGLTYLPLIGGLTIGSWAAARRRNALFSMPLRRLAIGLSILLLVAAFTHPEMTLYPALLVGSAMTIVFAAQSAVFGDRRIAMLSIVSYLAAAAGCASFARQVLEIPLPPSADLMCFTLATAALFVAGGWIDRRIARLPLPGKIANGLPDEFWQSLCRLASLIAAVAAAVIWLAQFGLSGGPGHAWPVAAIIGALLVAQSLKWINTNVSAFTYLFGASALLILGITSAVSFTTLIEIVTLVLLAQWILDYVFTAFPKTRVARAFSLVNRYSSFGGLVLLMAGLYLPALTAEMFLPRDFGGLSKVCGLFITTWAFDAARRMRISALTVAGCLAVTALVSVTWVQIFDGAVMWLPAIWAALGCATIPVSELLRRKLAAAKASETTDQTEVASLRAISLPLAGFLYFILGAAAIGTFLSLSWQFRAAGFIGAFGLIALSRLKRGGISTAVGAALVNWQAILVVPLIAWPGIDPTWYHVLPQPEIWLPLAAVAAVSVLLWQNRRVMANDKIDAEVGGAQRMLLRYLSCIGLLASLALPELALAEFVLAAATFVLLAASEGRAALRNNATHRAWCAEAILGASIAYFALFHVISFGRGISMFAVLLSGFVIFGISRVIARRSRLRVFAEPCHWTGLALPLVAACIAVARHCFYDWADKNDPAWFGMNSLAMLLAAGFYFWQGIESRGMSRARHCGQLVLSAVIANVALMLLWFDLAWNDPQLFLVPIGASMLLLVEMLRREIPEQMRDPLRYAGAILVLVSPTFDILGGSWLHILSLMALSVAVLMIAIGIRVRVLMYTGIGFLLADLVAMVVRGSIDHPDLLWLAGIAFGAAVVTLGAICERNRENLLQRMRALTAELETWN
jgi:hypothetical protein